MHVPAYSSSSTISMSSKCLVAPSRARPLTPLFRHLSSSVDADVDDLEAQSVSNRRYWTRRIHSLCAVDGDVDEALRLLDRLRLRGYCPDSLNLSSIVHALCNSGRSDEAHRRLLLFTASSACVPDDRTANVLVARFLDARTPALTLDVVRQLTTVKPAFIPSLTNYNRLIDHLCSQDRTAEARKLLLEMEAKGRTPNAVTYTSLIDGFGRIGELDVARGLFDEMVKEGVLPNSLTYSTLIKSVIRKRRIAEARDLMCELWKKMREERDASVNSKAFANLIDSLCREGYFLDVFTIAEEMPQGSSVNEEFAYAQMVDSLCKIGKHHGASRIVYILRKKGFTPSLVSYNCIIHGLSKDRGCMRAYQLFKEGITFGYAPAESTYKVLVEALCQEKDLSKAKDVVEFMLEKHGADRTRIYNIFLSALRVVENPSEQLNVLVSMLQRQCHPDVITMNTVIHGFCKVGKINEAEKIMQDMLSGKFCAPDVVTFTTMITGLMDVGKADEALDLLHKLMPECHCAPNLVTYNVVIRGLVSLQKIDEAMEIFLGMLRKGVLASSMTYTLLIDGLCELGRLEEAKKFWDDVIWPSKVHDDYVYAAILRGLCHHENLHQACDFLYELIDCGLVPGIINYNILIECACKLGLKKEAYQIVNEMKKNGLKPDAVTWRILDKLHKKEITSCNLICDVKMTTEKEIPALFGDKLSPIMQEAKEHSGDTETNKTLSEDLVNPFSMMVHEKDEHSSHNMDQSEGLVHEKDEDIDPNTDPLEGLVDPSFSAVLDENLININDGVRETVIVTDATGSNKLMPEDTEPLWKMTRRVFGLL